MARNDEITDAPDDSSTPYSIGVGERFFGALWGSEDPDWVSVQLTAGEDYAFGLQGGATDRGSLGNPFLNLRDSDGNVVASDDNQGIRGDSLLVFTPSETATYYLEVTSFEFSSFGTYMLKAWGEAAVASAEGSRLVATDWDSVLVGEAGNDHLSVDGGRGHFWGWKGRDTLIGGDGRDTMIGGWGNDLIEGGGGRDRLTGGRHQDTLIGGSGADSLKGYSGHDELRGGRGNDVLVGDSGRDTLSGGRGDDTLSGGGNEDTFVFADRAGNDLITDFKPDWGDVIDLSRNSEINSYDDLMASHISQSGADVVINDTAGNTTTLANVSLASLSQEHFLF